MDKQSSSGIQSLTKLGYTAHEWRHASAILQKDYSEHWNDIIQVLSNFRVLKSHVQIGGGGKSKITQALETGFKERGWHPKNWDTSIRIQETSRSGKPMGELRDIASPTHEVDHVKGEIALEIEWSNKDPFFDRDLNNFRLLFDLRVISVGIIITKEESLRKLFKDIPDLDANGIQKKNKAGKFVFCDTKFGQSTTWLSKLLPRIEGGGGGGCPILVIGITDKQFEDDKK